MSAREERGKERNRGYKREEDGVIGREGEKESKSYKSCCNHHIFQIFHPHLRLLSDQNSLHHPLVFENLMKFFLNSILRKFEVLDVHQNVSFKAGLDLNCVVRLYFDNLKRASPLISIVFH